MPNTLDLQKIQNPNERSLCASYTVGLKLKWPVLPSVYKDMDTAFLVSRATLK